MRSFIIVSAVFLFSAFGAHAQSVGYKVFEATGAGTAKYYILPTTSESDYKKADDAAKMEAYKKSIENVVQECGDQGGVNLFDVCLSTPLVTTSNHQYDDFVEVRIRARVSASAVCVFPILDEKDFAAKGLSRERPVRESCITE